MQNEFHLMLAPDAFKCISVAERDDISIFIVMPSVDKLRLLHLRGSKRSEFYDLCNYSSICSVRFKISLSRYSSLTSREALSSRSCLTAFCENLFLQGTHSVEMFVCGSVCCSLRNLNCSLRNTSVIALQVRNKYSMGFGLLFYKHLNFASSKVVFFKVQVVSQYCTASHWVANE